MQALSAPAGLNNALNAVAGTKQPGPPDHAKAWGWRAKQAAAAEAVQPTEVSSQEAGSQTAVGGASEPTATTAPGPIVEMPVPSEADMESVILSLIADFSETSGTDTTPLYNQVQALFS
ncbi:hypothetical protein [Pseudophaeobacter sp.]|uniref:hypothetical protein n=1 Tax=Pseudophaeobacter sp. TaxID=1971739 RepID=UPI00405A2D81